MRNSTANNTALTEGVFQFWVASMAFASASCGLCSYITVSLCHYVRTIQVSAKRRRKKPSIIFDIFLIVNAVTVLTYNVSELPLLTAQQAPFCEIQSKVKTACGALLYAFVYFSLWLRIYKLFYSNKCTMTVTNGVSRFLSRAALLIFLTSVVVAAWKFLSAPPYQTTINGCIKLKSQQVTSLKWGFLLGTTVTFEILLLYLLVYPLILHRRRMEIHGFDVAKIIPLIRKAFIVSLICIISDGATVLFAMVTEQPHGYLRHIVYGCNMLTNLLASLYSFSHWKDRLWPWNLRTRTLRRFGDGRGGSLNSRYQSSFRIFLAKARRSSRKDSTTEAALNC
ncbi:unnamed protein product [Clavelina lepadiformis]|uniref:Uncharacterized protein n=1 Tax=Clavelina lepadiformis TaxID=159417 RepID=A0ABP0FTW3_CLALP